jgi:CHAT domain-containing protein
VLARVVAAALCALAGCGTTGVRQRPVLREYRAQEPRRDVAHPAWLAASTADELHGRLSRDGRRLLYVSSLKGSLDLWEKDLSTGVPRRLTDHVAVDTQPCWSPDERRIAFVSMRNDVKGDLFLLEGDTLSSLTDRTTADAYPAFSSDGGALYFASGPEGQSRIERLSLGKGRERSPVTGWGATHPAPSPDGRYLAYTQFDEEGRGRIALQRLADGRIDLVTTPDYHAGFPAFSADGKYLYYSRFVGGSPGQPLTTDAIATIFRVETAALGAAGDAARATAAAVPLTSGHATAIFTHPSAAGLVFTTQRAGSLDVGLLPLGGSVPPGSARELLALALRQEDPRDQLLVLHYVAACGGVEAATARYRSAELLRELEEFEKAAAELDAVAALPGAGELAALARIDRAMLDVQRVRARERHGGPALRKAELDAARTRLDALPARTGGRVAAHRLLRRADLHRYAGETALAIAAYEKLVAEHPAERERSAEARFRLAGLFAQVREPALLSRYYLSLFSDFPEQEAWLRRAAEAVLALQESAALAGARGAGKPAGQAARDRQLEALRSLSDGNRDKPLFCALAGLRIAELEERSGRLALAIRSFSEVSERYSKLRREATRAAFELGRVSLALSAKLRGEGRQSEALGFYGRAIAAYERIVRSYDPGHEHHARARAEYLRLSLLEAGQLERDGELALAEKRYRKMLELDPEMLQAHRKLCAFAVARGEQAVVAARYRARLAKDAGDAVAHYVLGYLATFQKPLDESALARAEAHLQRAVDLAPQSPFGHMTLGWVHEMRERYLGQTFRGWLEEAIVLYERAYGLNDGKVDVQTEADLLVNQCSAFAHLGNGWKQAHELCGKRAALKLSFVSRAEEASFHLTYGRAASARGDHDLAARELARAIDLGRDLGRPRLEAEATARLALSAHLRGDHEGSNRLLEQALANYRAQGQMRRLAGLSRSLAYNLVLLGKHAAAREELGRARAYAKEHGTPAIEPWAPIGGVGRSTAPYGFDVIDEANAALAFEGMIHATQRAWPEIVRLLEARLANRRAAFKAHKDDELPREELLLSHRIALARRALGERDRFHELLGATLDALERLQTKPKEGFEPDPVLYPLEVAIALSAAEGLLAELAEGRGEAKRLAAVVGRLRLLEGRVAAARKKKKELLPERLALALESELALLSFHTGLHAPATGTAPAPAKGTAAERALGELLALGQPLADAVRLLRRVQRATAPDREGLPTREELASAEADALERGALAPLFRPLRPAERLRWHVVAGLNLAEAAAVVVAERELAKHPTTELLAELALLCTRHELGGLRYAVAAELAYRRGDAGAMRAAVAGYLARSPLLDPARSLQRTLIRRRIFARAVSLALREGELASALGYAEQEERRGFVEELSALPPKGRERARLPLERMLAAARRYRVVLAAQDPGQSVAARAAWRRKLDAEEQTLARELGALRAAAPRIAALFAPIPELPLVAIQAALQPGEVAVTALVHDGRVRLLRLEPGGSPASGPATPALRGLEVAPSLAELRREGAAGRSARDRLEATVRAAVGKAARAYLDLGRIDPGLRVESWLPTSTPVVRLATLWELVDAAAVRGLPQGGGLVVDRDEARAAALAAALGARPLPRSTPEKRARPLEEAGFLVVSAPLRFDGGLAPAARVILGAGDDRLADLRLGASLGLPLRGHLLVLTEVKHTAGREREEQVALARLVHAAGIPSLAVIEPAAPAPPGSAPAPVDPWRRPLRAAIDAAATGQRDLASALHGQRELAVALYGDGGLGGEAASRFAREALSRRVRSGAAAFNARRLPEAVEDLEVALRLMDRLGDRKYLDGALLFLANAYTLLEDYARAVPRMERLLALRRGLVDEARRKGAGKALLAAQAKLVQALQAMAWLRMRSEQYDQALAVNQQAIDLFLSVKRPLLAQPAYDQRSIIAERKASEGKRDEKSMQEALRYARLSLETAQALAKGKSAAARATVADAALRLARLQRLRFSDYGAAMAAARTALAQVTAAEPAALAESVAKLRALEAKLRAAGPAQPELRQQLAAATATKRSLATALETRVAIQLELVRIHSAKGDYAHAVEEAEAALEVARKAGLQEDAPLLELVNNLYYTGRYAEALRTADEGLKQAGKSELRKIQFYNAKGSILAALGRTAGALTDLREALRLARKLDRPVEVAASHNNLGNALRLAGRLEDAKEEFQRALAIDTRQNDRLGIAFDLANLGLSEELLGRSRDARKSLERAAALAREIGAPLNELKALSGLGRLELAAGRTAPALARFRAGLALSERLALRNWSWRFHLLTARAERRAGRAPAARAALEAGLKLTEELPPRQRRALGAPKVEEDPDDLYDELVDLLVEGGQAEAALDLAERARARGFVDRVSAGALAIPLKQAATALARITALQQELEAARATRARARPEEVKLADVEVVKATVALATERAALAALGPGLPSLVSIDVWPLAKLRPRLERLAPGTRLVLYHVGERQLSVFSIEGGRRGAAVTARRVPVSRRALEASIARLREALTGFHPVGAELRALHGWLIAPVLAAGPGPTRLVVVPSGPLHVLPFAALDDGRGPLPARFALSSLPSLNALRLLGAPPPVPRAGARGKAAEPSILSLAWSGAERPLSFAPRESEAVHEAYGAAVRVLRGAEATPAALAAAAPGADVIHVASHARYDADAPLLSALELHQGELRLVEVLGLKLKASLVVLSACETGLGHLDGADGILGLHQAFLLAGARRTISSLFRVSDLGSALLMKHLFRGLARGLPVDEALRAAQNVVRRRFPHPAFWAGFRLDGAPPEREN